MHSEIFLALAVSIDTYLAAAAYSNSEIKIPASSAAVISLISAGILGLSLTFSDFIGGFIPPSIFRTGGLIILSFIGIITIFKSIVRSIVKRLSDGNRMSLKMNGMGLVISLYLDDTSADIDNSKVLSASEASMLALASSLDSAAMGISCGFTDIKTSAVALLTFAAGFIAVLLGGITGKKISSLSHDFSWLGGIIIILFAIIGYIS
ncbi:MAG: sporulation protein [Ruminococcus sp.]|nr:sporulation protein [Ruminococcus sp.]